MKRVTNLRFSARFSKAKRWLISFSLVGLTCLGAPIGRDRASQVGRRWLELSPSPMKRHVGGFGKIGAYSNAAGEAGFYVVDLVPTGYVVIAADDELEPIIAFSHDDQFVPQPGNPLFDILQKDTERRMRPFRGGSAATGKVPPTRATKRAKWDRLAAPSAAPAAASVPTESLPESGAPVATLSDVRVDPLIQSRWKQSTVWNGSSSVAVFNYYTPPHTPGDPTNDVAGCVATAWAQIMRYHQWPSTGVGTSSFTISVDGVSQQRALRGGDGAGGPYDWANMALVPGRTITATQCQAIGALLHDAGVANNMSYAPGGSGAYLHTSAIKSVFHFANGVTSSSGSLAEITLAIRTNLDAGLPVALGIFTTPPTSGHEVVCDGYGYNLATPYHHLNLGWAGAYDTWYNLPEIDASGYAFDTISDCTYNIDPSVTGEIISGRCTDSSGNPVAGVLVTATGPSVHTATTNQRGIFAIKGLASNTVWTVSRNGGSTVFGPVQVVVTTGSSTDRHAVGNRIVDDFQSGMVGFTNQPINQQVAAGSNAAFVATAFGTPAPSLQWQVSTNGGSTWANLSDAAPYSGSATGTLAITGATLAISGSQYRCAATNSAGTATSNGAVLTVVAPPSGLVITIQVR